MHDGTHFPLLLRWQESDLSLVTNMCRRWQ